jgi:hypothetical protein
MTQYFAIIRNSAIVEGVLAEVRRIRVWKKACRSIKDALCFRMRNFRLLLTADSGWYRSSITHRRSDLRFS